MSELYTATLVAATPIEAAAVIDVGPPGPPGATTFAGLTDSPRDNEELAAELDAKANASHTHTASQITDLATTLAPYQLEAEKGQPDGYAPLDGDGLVPLENLPDIGGASAFADITGDPEDNTALDSALAGKADAAHSHSASDINSGTLPLTRGGTGGGSAGAARTSLDVPSNADLTSGLATKANTTHTHAQADVTNLVSDLAALDSAIDAKADASHVHSAADITSGTLPVARGGTNATSASTARTSLDVPSNSDLTTGLAGKSDTTHGHALTDAAITGILPAAKGGLGFDASGLGVSSAEYGCLDGVTGALQTQIDGKAASSHTHAASAITSGQLGLARGGTGADLSATGGTSQVLKQTTSGGAVTVGALTAAEMPSGINAARVGSGNVSNTEFSHLDGVTSALQPQIDGKQPLDSDLSALAGITVARGTIPVGNSSPAWSGLAKGSANQALRMDGSGNDPGWGTLGPGGGGTGQTSLAAAIASLLNAVGTPSTGQFLKWNGSAYEWAAAGGGMGLVYVKTLFGQPVESTNADTLYTVGTAASLAAGEYLLKFTAMVGNDAYKVRVAYRVNSGADIQNYAGTYYPNKPFEYAVTVTLSEGDSVALRAACSSYGYGAFANLEIWRIV